MVDRLLFYPWIAIEIDHVGEITSKAGWSPIPEGYRSLEATFPEELSVAVDKTAWDWTMPGWVVKQYVECKLAQCYDSGPAYERACMARVREVVGPGAVFRFPDGERLAQQGWGLMKSGWLLTLSMNSAAQYLQHVVACGRAGMEVPYMWAMGDDMLIKADWTSEQELAYAKALATTGCLVKHVKRSREFAGFEFTQHQVIPLYQEKHKFMIAYVESDQEQETLKSYFMLYALVDGFGWVGELREKARFPVGPSFRSWARGVKNVKILGEVPKWVLRDLD